MNDSIGGTPYGPGKVFKVFREDAIRQREECPGQGLWSKKVGKRINDYGRVECSWTHWCRGGRMILTRFKLPDEIDEFEQPETCSLCAQIGLLHLLDLLAVLTW